MFCPVLSMVMSVAECGAQPGGSAQGTTRAPLGSLRLPRGPSQRGSPPGGALLRVRQHVALPFTGEPAGDVRMHLDHVASPVLWAWSLAFEVTFLGDVYRLWPGALGSLKKHFSSVKGRFRTAHPPAVILAVALGYFVVSRRPGAVLGRLAA